MTSYGQEIAQPAGRVAIVGAGISGLAAAHRLLRESPSVELTLFEASHRLGGIIRTEEADGFLMELGPDSFITNKPAGLTLCQEIGFADQLISTDPQWRRSLVLHRGVPQAVPDGFMLMAPSKLSAILTTPVLSRRGRLRLLWERFVRPRCSADDESLASFVRRRFGRETLEQLVQPLVGGIYTSDPEKLSLAATMPRFSEMEQKYGSVIRGTLAERREAGQAGDVAGSGARYGLFATAAAGLSQLIAAVEKSIEATGRVQFCMGTPVHSVRRSTAADTRRSGWDVRHGHEPVTQCFDEVIIALSAWQAAALLSGDDAAELPSLLQQIEYASSAIVVSGHALADFSHPLDAFGLVVPAVERRRVLAVSFSSRKFPRRAPDGRVLLRTFVGGAMQPELLELNDDEIQQLVSEELTSMLGMRRPPQFAEVVRYRRAMPQYYVGHMDRVRRIEEAVTRLAGLHLAGSYLHGVGIPDSIESGFRAADAVLAETLRAERRGFPEHGG